MNRNLIYIIGCVAAISLVFGAGTPAVHAQEKLTLTVTPPFFELNLSPGEYWASVIKVVNTNPGELPVHVTVANFIADGERGQGKMIPAPAVGRSSLATWIHLTAGDEFTVPKGASREIPFEIRIPTDASPGGHYAAILVGTRPLDLDPGGSAVKISSFISSLFLVRVAGEVKEIGSIREFSADKSFYGEPEANFTLRFENKGNVHLHPQGDIVIYNMWGKERGRILVNDDNTFGNVLPQTIRQFQFDWKGENNLLDFGRYTAITTLTFGEVLHQNVSAKTVFWVIPVRAALAVLGGGIFLILLVVFIVNLYLRRALSHARARLSDSPHIYSGNTEPVSRTALESSASEGVSRFKASGALLNFSKIVFVRKFKWFLLAFLPLIILIALFFGAHFVEIFQAGRTIKVLPSSESPLTPPQ